MSWLHPIRTWRRRRAASQPWPADWEAILAGHVPLAARLPAHDQADLRRRVRIFLAEKRFEALGGLEMTDEIRVTIAAGACLLLLGRDEECYDGLASILVYPTAFRVHTREHSADGLVTESDQVRLGEAWTAGAVVLSWDDVRHAAADDHDGRNVVLHEFAHQLDMEDRDANGAPVLAHRSMYPAWAQVLGDEYARLQAAAAARRPTLLDWYGAESPAEFFAVSTETFFERPATMRERHPELYAQLRTFYGQDPAGWPELPDDLGTPTP
jgi:MtfA peptidase